LDALVSNDWTCLNTVISIGVPYRPRIIARACTDGIPRAYLPSIATTISPGINGHP
jgi:hypothetical protein